MLEARADPGQPTGQACRSDVDLVLALNDNILLPVVASSLRHWPSAYSSLHHLIVRVEMLLASLNSSRTS